MKNRLQLPPRSSGPRVIRAWGMIGLVLAIAFAFGGCAGKSDADVETSSVTASNVTLTAEQQQHIRLYQVSLSEFHHAIEVTGVVDFDQNQSTTILAPFSGRVTQLIASLGNDVKMGDPLAKVASPDFATAINAYRKALAAAKTARALADLDKRLLERHGVPQKEVDQAESAAVGAEADRDAALQQLVALQVPSETIKALEEGEPAAQAGGIIRSPIGGAVVQKLLTPGQWLQAGVTPCFTVADLSRVWVMAHVFETDAGGIQLGDTAEILAGNLTNHIAGKVDNISALVDPDTRSVVVRVATENTGLVLKKNMYVRVRIQARQANQGWLVPVSAILRDSENLPFVYLARPGNSFARQPVILGTRVDDRFEILSGLKPGDQIVVEGDLFMQFQQNQ